MANDPLDGLLVVPTVDPLRAGFCRRNGAARRWRCLTSLPAAALTVKARPADTVSATRAEYGSSTSQLRVEATSTSSTATLQVYVTATNQLIGTLTNNGGGKYSGQFTWPTNPQNATVKSSLGGSASKTVTAK